MNGELISLFFCPQPPTLAYMPRFGSDGATGTADPVVMP